MAAGRIFIPGWMPARDSDGAPIPNVSAYFYQNKTDVLATIYANEALTIPLANPVEANSSGRFPQIYADDANLFSVSVDAPYGPPGQPFTFDDLSPSQAADIAAANMAQGAAEDAEAALVAIEAAIDAATEAGGGDAALAGAIAGQEAANAVVANKLDKLASLAALPALASATAQVAIQYRTAPGDGYAGTFEWVSGDQSANVALDPSQGVWVAPSASPTGSAGAWRRIVEDEVRLEWFAPVGDGVTDDTVAFRAWFDVAVALGVKAVANGGTFLVDSLNRTVTTPLFVDLKGGTIKGAAGFATAVVELDGSTARPDLVWRGHVDSTLRDYNPGVASGTGLYVKRFHVDIRNSTFTADRDNTKGDSGIGTLECTGVIDNCIFIGHPDIGIYNTGGGSISATDDYGDFTVSNCIFEDCEIGLTFRRQSNRVFALGNKFKNCGAGLQTAEAQSGATWVPGAKVIIAIGNFGVNLTGAFMDIRAAAAGSVISSNSCTDWGTGSAASCYGILGCQGVVVTDNSAVLATVVATTHAGISLNNYTDGGGTVFTGQNNVVRNNHIINANTGVRDLSTGPNFAGFNSMLGVTTPYTGINNVTTATETGFTVGANVTINDTGVGFGVSPSVPFHAVGKIRSERSGSPTQYMEFEPDAVANALRTYSPTASGKMIRLDSRTDVAGTAPTGGAVGVQLAGNNVVYWEGSSNGIMGRVASLPEYADDAAAAAGGVIVGRCYRTGSTLKIRVA